MTYEAFKLLAERTGLEPATPGVTGRYSNQLNYHSTWLLRLPECLTQRMTRYVQLSNQVQQNLATPRGFEPRYSP